MGSIPTRSRQSSRLASAWRPTLALWGVLWFVAGFVPAARAQDLPSPAALDPIEAPSDTVGVPAAGRASVGDSGRVVVPPPGVQGGTVVAVVPATPAEAWHRQPKWIMFRSVAVPGWGQWANGRHWKAVLVAAGEGYLIGRAIDYGQKESYARRKARETAGEPALTAAWEEDRRYYASRRRDFTWWSVFAAVLSMGDAYVDAQLGPFDPEFEPQDGKGAAAPGLRAGLRWRLP